MKITSRASLTEQLIQEKRSSNEYAETFIDKMLSRYIKEVSEQKDRCVDLGNTKDLKNMQHLLRRLNLLQQVNLINNFKQT